MLQTGGAGNLTPVLTAFARPPLQVSVDHGLGDKRDLNRADSAISAVNGVQKKANKALELKTKRVNTAGAGGYHTGDRPTQG